MADETKKKLQTAAIIIGILVTATGAWSTVVLRGSDITNNKTTNVTQQKEIDTAKVERVELGTQFKVHQSESMTVQKNIERLQKQVDDGIELGTQRYIEILKRLPKK